MRIPPLAILLLSLISVAAPAYALSPVACTMDAKLCPDGVTYVGRDGNRNCKWQLCPGETDTCAPYVCKDGTRINKCAEDGTVINYFAAPCHTHGGEVDTSKSFSDVPPTHANAEAIAYIKAQGIVEGYADGTYKPDATINRAEFTKIIVKATLDDDDADCGLTWYPGSDRPFVDVSVTDWFGHVVCHAYMKGMITGYGNGTFKPANTINFAEAVKINAYAFFLPVAEGNVWYEGWVRALAERKAIPLSITRFDQPITRGEMAEMIFRLKTGNTDKPSRTYDELENGM